MSSEGEVPSAPDPYLSLALQSTWGGFELGETGISYPINDLVSDEPLNRLLTFARIDELRGR